MPAKEAILNYLDFGKPFVISTDASAIQLRVVRISQDGKYMAYYTYKLHSAQKKNIIGRKE